MAKKATADRPGILALRGEPAILRRHLTLTQDERDEWRAKYYGASAIIEALGKELHRLKREKGEGRSDG